jgi:hypothetical protein
LECFPYRWSICSLDRSLLELPFHALFHWPWWHIISTILKRSGIFPDSLLGFGRTLFFDEVFRQSKA